MTTAPDARRWRIAALSSRVVVPSLLVVVGCVVVSSLVAQAPGLRGALMGAALTSGFFLTGQVVLSVMRSVAPQLLLVVALLTYVLQIVVLLAVFAAFSTGPQTSQRTSTTALGLTILVCTGAWTISLVVASQYERVALFDVDGGTR